MAGESYTATAMAPPRRRFAPIPIETTYERVRAPKPPATTSVPPLVPTPELTPEGSPSRDPSRVFTRTSLVSSKPEIEHVEDSVACPEPVVRERRRFAPQLIETSRRARRTGDMGPATKPTDKTDITPYTNHIYQPHTHHSRMKKKDKEKDKEIIIAGKVWTSARTRRETEDVAFSDYLLKLAAREAERQIREAALAVFPNALAREGGVAHFYFRDSEEEDSPSSGVSPRSSQDEMMGGVVPPVIHTGPVTRGRRRKSSDLGWWHKAMQEHAVAKTAERETEKEDVDMGDCAIDDDFDSDYEGVDIDMPPPDPMWLTSARHSLMSSDSDVFIEDMPQFVPVAPASRPPPANPFDGFRRFGVPVAADQFKRIGPSPPMLGTDITFRNCPSPQHTISVAPALPEPLTIYPANMAALDQRPATPPGLWRGTCLRTASSHDKTTYVPAGAPAYVATPSEPLSPGDPFAAAFGALSSPTPLVGSFPRDSIFMANRARREAKARKEMQIREEFDDLFVTQVFNYLSLGYPPTAVAFDEELAKISGRNISELRKDDDRRMKECRTFDCEEHDIPESQRCARWKALRLYIYEWGRQCPNLESCKPVAWGMRERQEV